MQRERVTETIYVFTSELYVQVTAGLVLTSEGAVLIDTLLYPEETLQIKRFAEERLGQRVVYVINTHHHADHTTGTSFFPEAQVIAHTRCRDLLHTRGRESLNRLRENDPDMAQVNLVLPDVVFSDELVLHVGKTKLRLWSAPGHSPDMIVCHVENDNVLFAADAVLPLPYFVGGSYDECLQTLRTLQTQTYENIVQGHGEVVLRGEIDGKLESDVHYLVTLRQAVETALKKPDATVALNAITLAQCGKSPVLLNGAAKQLHRQNVTVLAEQYRHIMWQAE